MAASYNFEEIITCVICQEIYEDPVALSCLHTLCGKCVNNLKRNPKKLYYIECPLCRDMTDIQALKKDFRTKNLVDILVHQAKKGPEQSSSLCQLCQKRDIVCKCQDCDKLMCSDCRDSHIAIPLCERHVIKPVDVLIREGKELVQQILHKLSNDKEIYNERLQQIIFMLEDLNDAKQSAKLDIQTSEQYFLHLIKTYHDHLRTSIDKKLVEEKQKILSHRANVVTGICKLENTSQIVTKLANRSESSAVVAASLQVLKKVQLPELVLPEDSAENRIGFVDVNVQPVNDFKMSTAVEIKLCRCDNRPVRRDMAENNNGENRRDLSPPSAPNYEDLFPPLPEFSHRKSIDNTALPSQQHCSSAQQQSAVTAESLFSADADFRTSSNSETFPRSQSGDCLRYCDQVYNIVDELHAKHPATQPSAPPINSSFTRQTSRSMDSLLEAGAAADSRSDPYNIHDVQPLYTISDLKTKRLLKKRDIILERFDTPLQLKLISNEIWCLYKDKIQIYEVGTDNLLRVFRHENIKSARSMCQAHNGDFFIVSDNQGLLIFGPTRIYQDTCQGTFIDVTSSDRKVYALEQKKNGVVVFHSQEYQPFYPRQRAAGISHWQWKVSHVIQRTDTPSLDDTILVNGSHIYIGAYRGDCVMIIAENGEYLGQTGRSGRGQGELWRPRLCGIDEDGILVADFYNNRLQLLSGDRTWHVVEVEGLNFPWDALVDVQCGLLVLQQCNINHKIIQFLGFSK